MLYPPFEFFHAAPISLKKLLSPEFVTTKAFRSGFEFFSLIIFFLSVYLRQRHSLPFLKGGVCAGSRSKYPLGSERRGETLAVYTIRFCVRTEIERQQLALAIAKGDMGEKNDLTNKLAVFNEGWGA